MSELVERWRDLAGTLCRGISVDLILAVIATESGGRPGAWNPEPSYRWFWDVEQGEPWRRATDAQIRAKIPPRDFPCPPGVDRDAEWWGQQASWGLMQVMGAVARERGFENPDMPDLCDPRTGIMIGVAQLGYLAKRFEGADLLATYNGGPGAAGGNREYVDRVHENLAIYARS